MKRVFYCVCLLLLILITLAPQYTFAKIIFEDNFNAHDDWWPLQARPSGKCVDGVQATKCIPAGWTAWRNDEAWNPYDISVRTAATPGSHPTIQISSKNHTGSSGKGFTVWTESNKGWDGSGWGADGILAKKFDHDYQELYIRFKYKMQPHMQWTSYNGGAQIKTFRVQHTDAGAHSLFHYFTTGTNAPAVLCDIGVYWPGDGSTPALGSSHQTRCDPQNWDYVNYKGKTYKCIANHVSGKITPVNKRYWKPVPYKSTYPTWQPNNNYHKSNYYCSDGMGYGGTGAHGFVDKDGNISTSEAETLGNGNWHTFVFHVKMNSAPGVADGIYQFWDNGVLRINKTDRAYLGYGATPGIGWNVIAIGGNANNNYKHILHNYIENYTPDAEQWYAIDDIVVSTTPIPDDYVIGNTKNTQSPTVNHR